MKTIFVVLLFVVVLVAAGSNGASDANLVFLAPKASSALVSALRAQDGLYINAEAYSWNSTQVNSVINKYVNTYWTGEYVFRYPISGVNVTGYAQLVSGYNTLWRLNAGERRTWDSPSSSVSCDSLFECQVQSVFVAIARAKDYSSNKLSGIISQIGATVVAKVKRNSLLNDFKLSNLYVEQNSFLILTANNTGPWYPVTIGNDVILP